MAVPARRDGEEDDEGLFEGEEEEGDAWGDDIESDVPPHLRALTEAAQRGDVDALRLALDSHTGSIDDPVEDGDTLLHLCCLYGYLPCVQLLLERGASLETKDEEGAIPLHDACAGGFIEIVRYIISSAGNPETVKRMIDITDAEGDTPLHHAARGEHLDVVNLLLSLGASSKARNEYGKTPADLADPDTQARSVLEAAAATDSVGCQ